MGTGKTTVGRILARRYGLEFVDTDAEVERLCGKSVADLFAQVGEGRFREAETRVLRDALRGTGRVIATGGGTLVNPQNRGLLEAHHTVVCLTCDLPTIEHRVGTAIERPLFDARSPHAVQSLLAERECIYGLYPQIDTVERSPEEVAEAVGSVAQLERAASFSVALEPSSEVLFAEQLVQRTGEFIWGAGCRGEVFLLTDSRVATLDVCSTVQRSLRSAGFATHTHVIPEGEQHKTLETMHALYDSAMRAGLDRSAFVVGLGGGVIGDMAGLLAATYLRGLQLVLVPTTLLSQVDASIGGKAGVDFRGAKNMIGAFMPARLVLVDPQVLGSVSRAAMSDGMAEIIKIGFVRSQNLISLVDSVDPDRVLDSPQVIRNAAQQKVDVVQRDPLEKNERMLLNFGHTIGHGFEAASKYRLSHGQAVSIGMVAETRLAVARGWCDSSTLETLIALLGKFHLPTGHGGLDPDEILHFVGMDKKRRLGKIRLAIPRTIGEGHVVEVLPDEMRDALRAAERV